MNWTKERDEAGPESSATDGRAQREEDWCEPLIESSGRALSRGAYSEYGRSNAAH